MLEYLRKRTETFAGVDDVMDHYLLCLTAVSCMLGLAELLGLAPQFSKVMTEMNKLASHFVRVCLPLFELSLIHI